QTENYLTVIINKDEEYYEKTLRKSTKSTLCFFGIELPLFIDNKPFEFSDVEHNDSCIEIGTGKIGLKKDIYYEKIKKNANYTQEEMKAKAYEKMQQEISTHYPSDKVEILNTYYNEDVTENYFKLSVMLKCNEKIGEEKELNTDINVIPKTND
ncbi:MAG: sporulation protein YqfD, partial [Oscillospiraceae bacterium]